MKRQLPFYLMTRDGTFVRVPHEPLRPPSEVLTRADFASLENRLLAIYTRTLKEKKP